MKKHMATMVEVSELKTGDILLIIIRIMTPDASKQAAK